MRRLQPAQYLLGLQGLALLRRWLRAGFPDVDELLASTRALAAAALEPLHVDDLSALDAYGAQQETYDSGWNPLIAIEERVVQALVPPAGQGARALDAACGTGRHAEWLAGQGYAVTGVDFAPGVIEIARARLPGGEFRVGGLESLPLEAGTFDVVVCGLALALCEDIRRPVAELARVAKPGGRVLISDVHPASVMLGGSLLYERSDGSLAVTQQYAHWHGDYMAAFQAARLRVRSCTDAPWPMPTWPGEWYAPEGELRDTGQLMAEVSELALAGVPAVVVWELERGP